MILCTCDKTCTRTAGTGTEQVRVRVGRKIPRGYPWHSLPTPNRQATSRFPHCWSPRKVEDPRTRLMEVLVAPDVPVHWTLHQDVRSLLPDQDPTPQTVRQPPP